MLKVENLTKDFEATRAVDALSFELEPGDICGFIGPNGAGKTTTMRMITTLEEPTAGRVWVDGESIAEEPYRIRRKMGFMPDHYGTYPDLTVRDYLEFYARAYEVEAKGRTRRIEQIMEFTGLNKIAEKKVETLSKGMRQRLNLGRALVNDPRLLIMDEPAAGLDPRARIELRYLIRELAAMGKAVFISSHILSELSEFCDHMLIIDRGRMVTYGSFEEIQRNLQDGLQITVKLLEAGAADALERFLVERPAVGDVKVKENGVLTFAYAQGTAAIPGLVREMMNEGFPVIEFRPQTMTMEDVFIKITEGEFGEGETEAEAKPNGAKD